MIEVKRGRLKQSGTPQSPNLVLVEVAVLQSGVTLGAERFAAMTRGEARVVWYAREDRLPVAVAETQEALTALLAQRAARSAEPGVASAAPRPVPSAPSSGARTRLVRAAGPRKVLLSLPRPFHNPYNFVPFAPRPGAEEIARLPAPSGDPDLPTAARALADGPPPGHHAFLPDRWQGWVDVALTLVTPLLLPEAEDVRKPHVGHEAHKVFPVIERDGRPWIPATSLKGALRSAFEALTDSRLPRFDGHDGRMGYRRPASSALGLVGARVARCEQGVLDLEIYDVAALSTYPGKTAPVKYASTGQAPAHMDLVWVQVVRKGKNNVAYVTGIEPRTAPCPPGWQPGFAYITGQNINRKRCERVFYGAPKKVITARGADATRLQGAWRDLVRDYRDTHTAAEIWLRDGRAVGKTHATPEDYLGHEPGQTAWSAQIWREGWEELSKGSLCYASVGSNGTKVDALYPVLISRKLAEVSPRDLVPDAHLPATRWEEFSPADRVFGWVSERRDEAQGDASLPYRGHVRVGPITCDQPSASAILRLDTHDRDGLPLAILSAPKPRQGRFYVGRSDGTAQDDGLTPEQAGYAAGKVLRGRKVYPHQSGLPDAHWDNPGDPKVGLGRANQAGHRWYREYRRPLDDNNKEQRDDQNRSVLGWVKPGVRFQFRVHMDNLAEVELGALLTLLHTDPGWHLRLGGGKPLGFGSAKLEVVGGDLRLGDAFADRYRALTAPTAAPQAIGPTVARLRKRFRAAAALVWGEAAPHLLALEQAGQGYPDQLPVHYPRAMRIGGSIATSPIPTAKGESFRWFVSNDGIEGGGARFGYALDDLAGDRGLPVVPEPQGRGGRR